jgi:hypothetical protein
MLRLLARHTDVTRRSAPHGIRHSRRATHDRCANAVGVVQCVTTLGHPDSKGRGSVTHSLVVSIAVIVVTFVTLEWLEARRLRNARPRRPRGERLGAPLRLEVPQRAPARHGRGAHREEDSVKSLLAVLVGLAVAVSAAPAAGYVVEITTSIPIASAGDGL